VATLYVNAATGNNNTLKANNTPLAPWASIGRAVWGHASRASASPSEAAAAGDTVIVAAGAYTETVNSGLGKEDPLLTPTNSGTSGNPITIQTDGGVVTIAVTTYAGPVIGSYQKNYIVWDGFTINEADINPDADTGPVVFWDCIGCTLKNAVINGEEVAFNDNHCGVRVEDSDDILISNCFIQDITDSLQVGSENSAGVMLYTSSNVTIEKCTVTGCSNGIFVKGSNIGPVTIRYNLVHDQTYGIYVGGINADAGASDGCYVYENIVYGCTASFVFKSYDLISPVHTYVVNNTLRATTALLDAGFRVAGSGSGATDGIDNCIFAGNIVVDGYNNIEATDCDGTAYALKAGPNPSALEIEHNVYHNFGNQFSRVGGTNRTFATWKTFTGTDAATPVSVNADPLFIDKTDHDYRLNSGSPARMAVPDLASLYGGATRDAGARQFSANGAPIQIGYEAAAEEPPAAPRILFMRP
jgi:parallel beta-helix repeat protein